MARMGISGLMCLVVLSVKTFVFYVVQHRGSHHGVVAMTMVITVFLMCDIKNKIWKGKWVCEVSRKKLVAVGIDILAYDDTTISRVEICAS